MNFTTATNVLVACAMLLAVAACDSEPAITDDMLDGDVLFDPSIANPAAYLVSRNNPNPSSTDAAKPVFIAVHGYSATTFEWDEFRTWSGGTPDYLISQVLLAGHGLTYDAFRTAGWKDWQASIGTEFDLLVEAGYANINIVASSAGAALTLEMLGSGFFDNRIAPRNVFLVDPIVVPSDKLLSIVRIAAPIVGYAEADNSVEEDRYWYHYRPPETLRQLRALIVRVRKQLEDGVVAPIGTRIKVYKSLRDGTADPVSAVLIYRGLRHGDQSTIVTQMIDSDLHVFTRLDLREHVTDLDRQNQLSTFVDFVSQATD